MTDLPDWEQRALYLLDRDFLRLAARHSHSHPVVATGRPLDELKVVSGLAPTVASTQEARSRQAPEDGIDAGDAAIG